MMIEDDVRQCIGPTDNRHGDAVVTICSNKGAVEKGRCGTEKGLKSLRTENYHVAKV